jgi:chromosome segregation protein
VYLKSLVLKGFKSFADRAVLSLESGMTVVVGPNGSGKSNISDAVLWVLGEQSAKQLRGQAMEDVIFAGSSARQAVGLAEVDLVLDNTDGTLPLDFNEVVITRRMYRSGESEYLINGSPSRLMDVLDILNDSGLGRDTHSIISQGSLQNVLRARPEDRRLLIEEAAGILKYKKRKERSARKLKNMDVELQRVHDVVGEIDRQLKPLERQASRARQHEQLSEELKAVELSLAVDDLRRLQDAWNEAERGEKEADSLVEFARFRVEEKSRELEKYQRLLEEKGLFVGDIAEQRRRCQTVLERLDSGMLLLEEKGRNMVSRLSELRQTIHHSESRRAEAANQLELYDADYRDTSARLVELKEQLEEQQASASEIHALREEANRELTEANAQVRACEREIDECTLAEIKANETLSTADVEDGLLKNRIAQIEDAHVATQGTLGARRTRLEDIEGRLAELQAESQAAKTDIDSRVRVHDDCRAHLEESRDRLSAIRAEIRGLQHVDKAFDNSRPLLAWTMQRKEELEELVLPVSELFSAPADFEELVEQLLGSDMFGVLMKDAGASAKLAEELLSAKVSGGELSLISVDGKPVKHTRAKKGKRLLDEIKYAPEHARVAELLLGDVYVLDSAQEAIDAAAQDTTGSRFVTRSGVVAWPDGKVAICTQTTDGEGVLSRKRRMRELENEEPKIIHAVEEGERAVAEALKNLQVAQADDFELSQSIAQISGEADSLREEVGRLEQSITGQLQEKGQIEERRARIVEDTAASREKVEQLAVRKKELSAQKDEFDENAVRAREKSHGLADREDSFARSISAIQVDYATARERERHLSKQIEGLQREIAQLAKSLAVSRETETSLEILRLRVEPLYGAFTVLREGVTEKAHALRDRAQMEQAGQGDLRDTIEKAREAVADEQAKLDEVAEGLTQVRIEKSKLEVKVETAIKTITETHGVLLDIALATPAPEDREADEKRADKLRRKLDNLGSVNPVAVEEYRKLKERRSFMAVQIDDLEAAAKALQRIVTAIDRKMRNRFLDTFEQVNANFEEVFAQLFPGGNGHIELTDPSNPEETGVEVHAQPRGKMVRKQTLLSGGEQSLVALALLFAVYRVRKTPFYILDEVEAALDDTNLRRMLAYLDSIRTTTQFIIISHQRRTMEMADLLYGVSMRSDGVSKLVSQKLDQTIRLSEDASGRPRDVEEFSGAQ